jgi:hypothetical protein
MGGVALFRIERLILSLAITGACDKQATSPRRKTGSFRSTMLTADGADLRDCECWNRTLAPDGGHASALPATQCARAVHDEEPLQNGGGREDRMSNAPAASYAKVESIRVSHHRFTGSLRPSLRNGFNGFFRARPGDRALLSPWVTTLARCTGYQRRDIRPTRLRRPLAGAFVSRTASVHRIPPNVRDDGQRPSSRARRAGL